MGGWVNGKMSRCMECDCVCACVHMGMGTQSSAHPQRSVDDICLNGYISVSGLQG